LRFLVVPSWLSLGLVPPPRASGAVPVLLGGRRSRVLARHRARVLARRRASPGSPARASSRPP